MGAGQTKEAFAASLLPLALSKALLRRISETPKRIRNYSHS